MATRSRPNQSPLQLCSDLSSSPYKCIPLLNSTCTPTVNIGEFTLYSLIPAALIVVVLSFTIQRVKRRHYCNGYPGLVHPIDFLRYDRNRFAHAAAFGATAGGCLQIFEKKFYIFGISASSSSWLMKFKYPTRILATFLVAQIAVYKIAFVYGFVGFESFRILKGVFYVGEYLKLANVHNPKQNASLSETHRLFTLITQGIAVLQVSWTVATISSCLLILFYSLHMISCIRKHLLRLYCGSTSFLPQKKFSPTLTMAHSLRYSGYQIGYILWGFIISQVFLFVIAVLVAYFIVLPIMGEIPPVLLNFLVSIWPSIAFSAAAYFIQYLLSRYCLLKNRGKDGLVVDNRRLLSNAAYFLFFYNIILGLFSALFRLLESLVLGVLFISRLDKSLLIRGYESWDSGYNAYLGFLHVEYHYNHPGAAVFCQLLIDSIKDDSSVNSRNSINTYVEEDKTITQSKFKRIDPSGRISLHSKWCMSEMITEDWPGTECQSKK
ncbi:uncharacterized protein TRIADDRAFT_54488 [Trichoplax adhaerens]|uniref:Receptor for retinol uptake STRA6 n=1 Tax=Trichoplax adhaerens TaxID=10228 RepID=B3RS65_TRIAD|nr:hypothetical protein TRIADDRAFT_54488 [Trichoplax adhaerens]EDV27002.1 hypothetical protein TRIADDRAFT_54488 [Trichoplax adhaerens]|eukprot:XP_002110998.1 hypothetical protein TRIADDRAFT_54488 [Trichoplax adhaerens]